MLFLCTPVYVALAVVNGHPEVVPLDLACGLLYGLPFLLVRRGGDARIGAHLVCAIGTAQSAGVLAFSGGLLGGAASTLLLPAIAATLTIDARAGWTWFAAAAGVLLVMSRLEPAWVPVTEPGDLDHHRLSTAHLVILTGVFLQLALTIYARTNDQQRAAVDRLLAELEDRVAERTEALRREVDDRREAEAAARAASQAKSTFLANMSHELRTPLNAILGYTELVAEELDGERADLRGDLARVMQSGRHLLSLIDHVLDLARIERGQLALDVRAVSLCELVADVATMARPQVMGRGNTLTVDVQAPDGATVWGDPTRLRQILINLLSNANRFTDEGRITLRALHRDDGYVIEVEDTGVGIAPEKLDLIFGRFAQVDASSTRRRDGAGLGLAIARDLAEAHHGHLRVASTVARGSTFSLWLPRPQRERTAVAAT